MARKRLLTVEGALMLHLLDFVRQSEQDTVPLAVTQAGISLALGVRRSHVAQSLDAAIGQGNVEERLSRVKGERRKRKCYFLTGPGVQKARAILAETAAAEVEAALPDGSEFRGRLDDLVGRTGAVLPATALRVSQGRVNLAAADQSTGPPDSAPPPPEGFCGRAKELGRLGNLISGKTKVLGLTGMPGIGKTALMAKALSPGANAFWYRVSDWSGPRHAASHLAAFLGRSGSQRLGRYLAAHEAPDLGDMHDMLAAEKAAAILVFDDCHRCSQGMTSFLGMLAQACLRSGSLKLCLVGRSLPEAGGMFGAKAPEGAEAMVLGPLDPGSSLEILTGRGITGARAKAIAGQGGGHPLYLMLAGEAGSPDVAQMLAREVHSSMSQAERAVMLQAAVYRQPVAAEALAENEEEVGALDSLADRNLLVYDRGWSMHSLLRDFFSSRQTQPEKAARHERAAEYYRSHDRSVSGQVEALYHLFMAGDYESAMMGLAEAGGGILAQGYTDETIALCAMAPGSWDNATESFQATFLKASALELSGRWAEAAELYAGCLDLARSAGERELESKALRSLGAIEYRRGNLDAAKLMLEAAMRALEPGPVLAEIMGSLGVVQWKIGDAAAAAESHSRDLEMSEAGNDLRGISRALNNLGILDWAAGRNAAALERYSRALSCAERIPDNRLVAILYSNLGDVHMAMGNAPEAKRYYERCLALAEDLGFHWQAAEAYRGLAQAVPERRRDYLSRALTTFERLGAKEDAKTVREMLR